MVEPRVVIFVGKDDLQKDKRLESIQKKAFPPELKDLNFTILYADDRKVTLNVITEALSCMPTSGAKERVLVIKNSDKLDKKILSGLVINFKKTTKTIVVMDFPESKVQEDFLSEAKKAGAQVVRFKETEALTAFDLGRAITSGRTQDALKILLTLLRYKDKSEKILGAIFWQWERSHSDRSIGEDPYRKGLKIILDADKRLKSSVSTYARESLILETLVVKLAFLAR